MEKYKEQQSKIKTVSIRRIYEWLSAFLLVVQQLLIECKNNEQFELIKNNLGELSKVYREYIHADKQNLLKTRKKLCESLKKAYENICDIISSELSKGNSSFKNLNKNYNSSLEGLNNDLMKIDKESKVKSAFSAAVTIMNKKSEKKKFESELENNKKILINYSKNVIPIAGFCFIKCKKVLDEFHIDFKECRYVKAITAIIGCWTKDYPISELQKAITDDSYCKVLYNKLQKCAEDHGIPNMYEISILLVQWMPKIPLLLKDYLKCAGDLDTAEKRNKNTWFAKWKQEFTGFCGKIENEDEFFNRINELKELIEQQSKNFNQKVKQVDDFIAAFTSLKSKIN